ncbi:catalase [Tsukamurella sp. 8F]|uniref:catalase n=1 Tax=unclassified Tsukamurella TaxID=2633480 RepID=UPI0023B8C7CB|nr:MULTISPECIES: catalase [unclassified Tsukamurella]MDF0532107.1 catalase [Tsukamurella sp. 8J]MDF0589215.1 catalase [Tsukamurella sp. 8F]
MSIEETRTATTVGEGGELHQDAPEALTTSQGAPVSDNENSLRGGDRGPTLLEDNVLRDKIFRFDHERIPERVVHARGFGAHGVFECTRSLADVTAADVFAEPGRRTEVFVRFSTVAGRAGSSDLARDVRGFAVKFYTREGNWDLVGNNIPVFFIQDAMKFPDLVHSLKEDPDRGFPQAQSAHDTFWDFVSLMPEATHMTLWQMSDRAIPRSFRFMQGFGVHTFRFLREDGASTYVKFHWKPVLGCQSVLWDEAVKINGADPDYHRRDLWNAIGSGDLPQWELGVQLFDEETAQRLPFDVLDPTKIVPEEDVPVQVVGRMTLDRTVDNEFAETEQVAFCTQNIVPGIGFTDDPLLQGRNFSYLDTQVSRLGSPNFTQLPVNSPRCPVAHFHRDGQMQTAVPRGQVDYEPNGAADRGPRERPAAERMTTFAEPLAGEKTRLRAESFADHYSQARVFWISQTDVERDHIVDAYVFELSKVRDPQVRSRMVANLRNVELELAERVASGLGLGLPEPAPTVVPARTDLPESPAVSMHRNPPATFAGRKLGVLVTDGAARGVVESLQRSVSEAGATVEIVAPSIGGVVADDGSSLPVDERLAGAPSVLFDAIAVVPSAEGADRLARDPAALDFVTDAFYHHKFMGVGEHAGPLLERAGILDRLDLGCPPLDSDESIDGFVAACAGLRLWQREIG